MMLISVELPRPVKRIKYDQGAEQHPMSPSSDSEPTDALSPMSQILADDRNTIWTPPSPESQNPQLRPQQPHVQIKRLPRLLPAHPNAPPEPAVEPEDPNNDETAVDTLVVSPFTVYEDPLPWSPLPRYTCPENGQVNGYVKFRWRPSRSSSRRPSGLVLLQSGDGVEDITRSHTLDRNAATIVLVGPESAAPDGTVPLMRACAPPSPQDTSQVVTSSTPNMLPPQFGFQAKMDHIDRRLFDFYTKNWCPGRSVLIKTNLWLRDLAPMHENEGIRHAILSLAGIYIYDYLSDERIRQRINQRYILADQYFSTLLNAPESREKGKGQEVIAMAVLLSMQDIILTERRLEKPYQPRWLEGSRQAEYFLQATDPGDRYWKPDNVQYSELRISQSIIVGRAVILAQPMMALPTPETFNPEAEAGRFGWLLYGTEKDMFEIHGGCGFSKKLLHLMSQVTYCAGRLHQEPKSTIVPITARFLLRELSEMRQWSREGKDWELVQKDPPTIDWVRGRADDVIDSDEIMTEVTAEAWRIAAIIYYQCRLLRFPRNHPEVLANLDDLARCIRIMPTSGSHFTAQAPLLPVFFLGLLATVPKHKAVSKKWFEQVVQTPVRSSVPPLYEALKRIWKWIDKEVKVQPEPNALSKAIGERCSWWEQLVAKVYAKEKETLCLT